MQHTSKKIGILLILGFSLTCMQGQNALIVNRKSGANASFVLTDIAKLTFAAGNMTVNKKTGNAGTYALTDIRYLNFSDDFTGTGELATDRAGKPAVYPNPATDELHIRYTPATATRCVRIEIIDLQGKTVYSRSVTVQVGAGLLTVPVHALPRGLYLCRVQQGNNMESTKFIKQ